MPALKCKMCGGDLLITPDSTVCECEYCGSKQTIPVADDEKKMTLFARANRLRFNCEFDKASGVYESIVAEFPEEAEAYWGLVLCKYGIEYVDDPATARKIPTCHRTSFDAVLDDRNFELACEYAGPEARRLYREEAKAIETIRRGIIEVSGKEAPYDVFICYKETDDNGDRTLDSVLAQDIYTALTEKGLRVFFSRITLEDKLGREYEPYIFAALHSARVMLAVGTQFEYYDAVWVKNEWSRYLKLIEAGEKKTLIPCFKNLDPYDMPKEFVRLQAQDLGKVGAMQDLLRGVEKILGGKQKQPAAQPILPPQPIVQQVISGGTNLTSLLKRGYMAMEDGNHSGAADYFNRVLDMDSECAEAYLGLFALENKFKSRAELKSAFMQGHIILNSKNWQRVRTFAKGNLAKELAGWEEERKIRLQLIEERRRAEQRRQAEIRQAMIRELREVQRKLLSGNFGLSADEITIRDKLAAGLAKKQAEFNKTSLLKISERKALKTEIEGIEKSLESIRTKELRFRNSLESRFAELHFRTTMRDDIRTGRSKTVLLGRYEQGSGLRPIEWIVLAVTGNYALLVSKFALEYGPYNDRNIYSSDHLTWEECTLRKWLNAEFLQSAFNSTEQSVLAFTQTIKAVGVPGRDVPANAIRKYDRIFLLSGREAAQYCRPDSRICQPTPHLLRPGDSRQRGDEMSACRWWLRSVPEDKEPTVTVDAGGNIHEPGAYEENYCAVRPAVWLDMGD